jgi:hypothetical protein
VSEGGRRFRGDVGRSACLDDDPREKALRDAVYRAIALARRT